MPRGEWVEINPSELAEGDAFVTDDGSPGVVAEKVEDGLYVKWTGEEANWPVDKLCTWEHLGREVQVYREEHP